eukprot:TRINITY_DN56202_c0_g1_i1.p1 TRINITY_DN56202_c0_g1~~TRINITY_DN56202_c0_g1_i1.p1  ORF type:complete len:291 (-),score=109.64 TRINITY_DN56202_c0_g1_i1:43-915(-)
MSSSSSSSDAASDSEEEKKASKKGGGKDKSDVQMIESGSGSSSDSDSDSSDDSSSAKKKKQKKKKGKEKKQKKKKKEKGGKGAKKKGKKDGKVKKAKKGKDKKKKKKKSNNPDAVSNQFGKFGIIKQEDFFNKKPEFLMWAMEVKKVDTDALGQMQMRDLFKEFVEDYNTATMPSKKYYNLQDWDAIMAKKRQKKTRGDEMSDAQRASLASFDDESARKQEIKHLQAKKAEAQMTSELNRLRQDKSKVDEMKSQNQLRSQMDMMLKAGHHKTAEKLKGRLDGSAPLRERD